MVIKKPQFVKIYEMCKCKRMWIQKSDVFVVPVFAVAYWITGNDTE